MATARNFALRFTSILILFTIFWFLKPSQSSSPPDKFHGLERILPWLQHRTNWSNNEAQYPDKDFHRLEHQYDPVEEHYTIVSPTTSNLQASETPPSYHAKPVDLDQGSGTVNIQNENRPQISENNSTGPVVSPTDKVMNSLEVLETIGDELWDNNSAVSSIASDGEIMPVQEQRSIEIDSNQNFPIFEVLPDSFDLELEHKKTSLNIIEVISENSSLPIVQEKQGVLEEAEKKEPMVLVDEIGSNQDFKRPKVLPDAINSSDKHFDSVKMKEYFEHKTIVKRPLREMDGIALNIKNFSNFISENKYVVVNFYMPWAHWSEVQALEYAEAVTMLEGKVLFAKVDAHVERKLAREYRFVGYSTLYFFIDGVHLYTYRHCCKRDGVVSWLTEKMNGVVQSVTRPSKARDILKTDSMFILACLDALEGPDSEEFAAASKLEKNIIFYQTDSRYILTIFHLDSEVKSPALFVLRKDAGKFIQFDGPFTRSLIADFVHKNKFPLVSTFNAYNCLPILQNRMIQLWLFAMEDEVEKVMPPFKEAAEAFNGKILFVYIKMDHEYIGKRLSYTFGGVENETTIVAYSGIEALLKCAMNGELSLSSIKSFGEAALKDELCEKPIISQFPLFEGLLEW